MYQDLLDWLNDKQFQTRAEAESYIKSHQEGTIYPQQTEALDWYFEQEEAIESPTLIEALQRGEFTPIQPPIIAPPAPSEQLQKEMLQKEIAPLAPVQSEIPAIKQERQNQLQNLFRKIRQIFGRLR